MSCNTFFPLGGVTSGGGGGGGGGEPIYTFTHTTVSLNGDSNGDGPRYEDVDMPLGDTDFCEIVNVAVRRSSGTGASPSVAVSWYPTDAYGDSFAARPLIGSSFSGAAVPTDGGWVFGPALDISGTLVPAPALPRDEDGTNAIHLRITNAAFGTHPDDDAAFELVIHYRKLTITLPEP